MTKTCFNCKYSSVHRGMQSCVWKSGLASAYTRCERFERDWGSTIGIFLFSCIVFIFPFFFIIYLVLYYLGWFN